MAPRRGKAASKKGKADNSRQPHLSFAPPPPIPDEDPIEILPDNINPTTNRVPSVLPKTGAKRWAWCYKHMPDKDPETRYICPINRWEEWRCAYCSKVFKLTGGTKLPNDHLEEVHKLTKDVTPRGDPVKAIASTKQTDLKSGLKRQWEVSQDHQFKRRKLAHAPRDSIDPNKLEALYIRFIAVCSQPLQLAELDEFRELLIYLNEDVECWLPVSHSTIGIWVERQYKLKL
ncbi:hypothetical protein BJ875DRAFT_544328 [Amylocarpus encephaloides]|uniref:BED-type domain-containing protein n=1 Tax=Amylocarpus encephaloides TaxID=45428 RepID=A0A9P7YFF7_9HELO|nr:hypothetical protein BJ875DRAFT_544328 [Amylocarpus encephaloides]